MAKTLFGLGFSEAAADFLDRMPSGKIRAQVAKKAKSLILNPHPAGCKKLKGRIEENDEPVWRVRSGDYRILYIVREIEVIVLDIGHRKDVYK
jgi:mRNA interferase RelE/StbE